MTDNNYSAEWGVPDDKMKSSPKLTSPGSASGCDIDTSFVTRRKDADNDIIPPEEQSVFADFHGDSQKLCIEACMPLEEMFDRGVSISKKLAPHLCDLHNRNPKSPMLRAKTDAKIKISTSVRDGTTENAKGDACNNAEVSTKKEIGPCDSVRSGSKNRNLNIKDDGEEDDDDKQNTCDSTMDDFNIPSNLNEESVVLDTSEAEVSAGKKSKDEDNGAISSSDNMSSACGGEVLKSSTCDPSDNIPNTLRAKSAHSYADEEETDGADSSPEMDVPVVNYSDLSDSSEDDDEGYGVSESSNSSDEEESDEEESDEEESDEEESDEEESDEDDFDSNGAELIGEGELKIPILYCSSCKKERRREVKLNPYMINEQMSLFLCPAAECFYPLNRKHLYKFVYKQDSPGCDLKMCNSSEVPNVDDIFQMVRWKNHSVISNNQEELPEELPGSKETSAPVQSTDSEPVNQGMSFAGEGAQEQIEKNEIGSVFPM